MDDLHEDRELFRSGELILTGHLRPDPDADAREQDFETPADREDFLRRWEECAFSYVTLRARVLYGGREISVAELGGVEHGAVSAETTADAWEVTPAHYFTVDGRAAVQMGSPLTGLACEALDEAREWLGTLHATAPELTAALAAAQRWFDPNRPEGTR